MISEKRLICLSQGLEGALHEAACPPHLSTKLGTGDLLASADNIIMQPGPGVRVRRGVAGQGVSVLGQN